MSEVKKIVEELKNIHEGDAWHGPSLRELLANVTIEQAKTRPIPGAHNIWELVLHIAAWEEVFNHRLKGDPVVDPEDGDFPQVRKENQDTWKQTLERLERSHQQLLESISALTDSALQESVVGNDYSIDFMLRGVVRHHVYHAGQIGLLKKAIAK